MRSDSAVNPFQKEIHLPFARARSRAFLKQGVGWKEIKPLAMRLDFSFERGAIMIFDKL